jgi:hypothetical protein
MMRLKSTLLLAGVLALFGLIAPVRAGAAPFAAPRPPRYVLPGDQVFPEGIAYQQGSDHFYVSSTSDGTIFRGSLGKETASVFLPGGADGRTTAVGLKADRAGRLFVAGGTTGRVFVYDTASGALLASFSNGRGPNETFINDVAVTGSGDAYFTDSIAPVLYRVSTNEAGAFVFEEWLNFTGTPLVYQPGFNLNGIVASENGKYLVVVQSNTGKLFRIEIATKAVTEIDLGGTALTNGDGLLLRGRTLYVVRNQQGLIVKLQLSGDLSNGAIVSSTTDPSLAYPTTIAEARGRLLVVNSQFDKRGPGLTPELPFTVSSIHIP